MFCFVNGETATNLELPLDTDQATKFLDEHDLHDVLNKMPDEAFDLLTGRNSQSAVTCLTAMEFSI